jgi:NAD(P)H-dependent flavin oxidoreductase YrpB (nitropropane dioxygenase family)
VEVRWELPLMQAPIGPAATPELVIAVGRAHALGTLAAAWTEPGELRRRVRHIRAALDGPFCVNLVLAFEQSERLAIALEEGAPAVSFSWGVDPSLIRIAHERGAAVLVQVGDVRSAEEAAAAHADALIAQGTEAGGHVQGTTPTVELVRALRRSTRLPLVAAGGIGDARAAAEALAAGADAAACGTAFLAAREADVHPAYLDRLVGARPGDTVVTTAFDGGWPAAPHRVIRNSTLTRWEAAGEPPHGGRPGGGEVVGTRDGVAIHRYDEAQPTRETSGEIEAMAMYAGTSVAAVTRGEPAADIVGRLTAGLA